MTKAHDGVAQRAPRASGRPTPAGERGPSRAATVQAVRESLGRTQAELATALGISAKAVQSYEQGWRAVPVRVMIQLLVLLALYRRQTMTEVPCWEIRRCTPRQRECCASFTVGRGQFCWFVGSKACRPPASGDGDFVLPCMGCPVVRRLLAGKLVRAPGKGSCATRATTEVSGRGRRGVLGRARSPAVGSAR